MKWFFALNEACKTFSQYAEMVKVAVHSARQHTQLVPHFIYDGQDNALTDWLRGRGVTIIQRRSFLYDHLATLAARRQNSDILSIGAGAFLRVELPALGRELGFINETVLYTDCDVLFLEEVEACLQQTPCQFFAVAPESDPGNYKRMNTGVMLMNLSSLGGQDLEFRTFIVKHLESLTRSTWDQRAYQRFFRTPRDGRFFFTPQWQHLPITLNWKPYWQGYTGAKIIHFHGLKPFQQPQVTSAAFPKKLRHLARGSYHELCCLWRSYLEAAQR
jgi:hypothetical protein